METWAPDYGASVDGAGLADSDAEVDLAVERDPAAWAPVRLPAGVEAAACVLFVDGVQRIDAWIWITCDDDHGPAGEPTGEPPHQGVCASWAAGVVRCHERARVVVTEVRRGCFAPGCRSIPSLPVTATTGPMPCPTPPAIRWARHWAAPGRPRGSRGGGGHGCGRGQGRAPGRRRAAGRPAPHPGRRRLREDAPRSYLPAALQCIVTGLGSANARRCSRSATAASGTPGTCDCRVPRRIRGGGSSGAKHPVTSPVRRPSAWPTA